MALENISRIRFLELTETAVTDAGFLALNEARSLRHLTVASSLITDKSMPVVGGISNLRVLQLDWIPGVTDVGTVYLSKLSKLSGLFLNGIKLTDSGLKQFSPLTRITSLSFGSTSISDDGVASLRQWTQQLDSLDLHLTSVTGAGFGTWPSGSNLFALMLKFCPIDDAGVRIIVKTFPMLKSLDLSHTKITDDAINSIRTLPALNKFKLNGTAVTDAGFRQLIGHPRLQVLGVSGTNVSESCLSEFRSHVFRGYYRIEESTPLVASWSPETGTKWC